MLPLEEIEKSVPVLPVTNVCVAPDWPLILKTATPQLGVSGAQSGVRVSPGWNIVAPAIWEKIRPSARTRETKPAFIFGKTVLCLFLKERELKQLNFLLI